MKQFAERWIPFRKPLLKYIEREIAYLDELRDSCHGEQIGNEWHFSARQDALMNNECRVVFALLCSIDSSASVITLYNNGVGTRVDLSHTCTNPVIELVKGMKQNYQNKCDALRNRLIKMQASLSGNSALLSGLQLRTNSHLENEFERLRR